MTSENCTPSTVNEFDNARLFLEKVSAISHKQGGDMLIVERTRGLISASLFSRDID